MKRLGITIFLFLILLSSSKADLIYDYCAYCNDSVICHTQGIVHQDNYLLLGLNAKNKELIYLYYQDVLDCLIDIKGYVSKKDITYRQASNYIMVRLTVLNANHELINPSPNLFLLEIDKKIVTIDKVIIVRHINYVIDILNDNKIEVKKFNL